MKKIFIALLVVTFIAAIYFYAKQSIPPQKDDFTLTLNELEQKPQLQYALSLDIPGISQATTYKIIGGGNLKLPSEFQPSENPQVTIVHGINLDEISSFIKSDAFKDINNSDGLVIITALALKRCFMDKKSNVFREHLENFKKTGDINNSNGSVFYYLDELDFEVKNDMSGIVFAFPESTSFTHVKNYGLAHLIQNDFSLEGLHNPINFLEYIQFPKPDGFNGTFDDLILSAKAEFHNKFFNNIVQIDFAQGKTVTNKILPFIELKSKNKILPLIKSVKLSKNIYFSGITPHVLR